MNSMVSFLRIVPCLPHSASWKMFLGSSCTCGEHTLMSLAARPSSWHTGPESRMNYLASLCQQQGSQMCWFTQFLRKNQWCQVILQEDWKRWEHKSIWYSFGTLDLAPLDAEQNPLVLPHKAGVLGGPSIIYHHPQVFMPPQRLWSLLLLLQLLGNFY